MHFNASCLGKRLQIFRTRYLTAARADLQRPLKYVVSLAWRGRHFIRKETIAEKNQNIFAPYKQKKLHRLQCLFF